MKGNKKNIFLTFLLSSLFSWANPACAQEPPQLLSPPDGATNQPTTITFEWSSAKNADRYQIDIDDNPDFSSASSSYSTQTSIEVSNFEYQTTYYWRVRSGEDQPLLGGTVYGNWSEVRRFTTVEESPAIPVLTSPEDAATDISTTPTLNWEPAQRADTYRIQVAQNNDFSSPNIDQAGTTATKKQVSGLQPTTTYYWRIQANNTGGTSSWSEVRSFTTTEPPPPVVQLITPANGAKGITTTPKLDWDTADRANVYDIQIATDQNFNEKTVNLNNITSTKYDAELQGYTTYYWRVRGENDAGPGEWSEVWTFTTEQTGKAISLITPSKGDLFKAPRTISIRWTATNNIANVTIEYKLSSDKEWALIAENVVADSGPYAWDIPNVCSPQTLIRISDSDNPDRNVVSNPFILYGTALQLDKSYNFNSASSTSDYKLVGLPAKVDIPLGELVPGKTSQDWNAYFDNGTQKDYLVEFDGSNRFNLQPGRAFFVISKNDFEISEKKTTVSLDTDTTYSIPLHDGWNMIANPFGITIPWKNVLAKNNISATLWAFEGRFTEAAQFEAYKGYYFYNKNSLKQLHIPYQPVQKTTQKNNTSRNNKQSLKLTLINDGIEKSSIAVGFDPSLNGTRSGSYRFSPPGNFQDYKLTIESEKFTGRQSHLSKEFFPVPDTKQTFSIQLKSKPHKPIEIKATGLEKFDGYEIALINRRTAKSYDLTQGRPLLLTTDKPKNKYLLIIGTKKEVKGAQNNLKPEKVRLAQNYPNPFNGQTVIEYSIPKRSAKAHVDLEIFDVLGRKILTLVNKRQQAGSYQVRWNGKHQSLASGVYYYRLKIGQTVLTKRLTLIK